MTWCIKLLLGEAVKVFFTTVRAYRLDFAQGLHNYSIIFASQTLLESYNA